MKTVRAPADVDVDTEGRQWSGASIYRDKYFGLSTENHARSVNCRRCFPKHFYTTGTLFVESNNKRRPNRLNADVMTTIKYYIFLID